MTGRNLANECTIYKHLTLSYKIEFKNILLSEIISTMSKNAYYCLTLISWPTITYERKAVLLKATKKMC